jgi:hypothetical protein
MSQTPNTAITAIAMRRSHEKGDQERPLAPQKWLRCRCARHYRHDHKISIGRSGWTQ